MIVSFGETTEALLAGVKTVTRRKWADSHAVKFEAGSVHKAYDKVPFRGGKHIADIRLTAAPYKTRFVPDADWEAEGFAYMAARGLKVFGKEPVALWMEWANGGAADLYVVRFDPVR